MSSLNKKNILIGVTGGIAIYKTCDLISCLKKCGANVKVIMTAAATKFITPLTFQTLSQNSVYTNLFSECVAQEVPHISLAKWCNICVIAPATANSISKIAYGIADNILTSTCLAIPPNIPMLIAPSMNNNMWSHPMTQKNIKNLKFNEEFNEKRYYIIGPRATRLACGDIAEGAMAEIDMIFQEIKKILKID